MRHWQQGQRELHSYGTRFWLPDHVTNKWYQILLSGDSKCYNANLIANPCGGC